MLSSAILKLNRDYAQLGMVMPLNPTAEDTAKIRAWTSLFDEELRDGSPHHAQAYANYGMLCYRMGMLELGRKYYETAERVCQAESYGSKKGLK
ncbi:Uncharacterized protein ALO79_04722 [Pseudomonas syringae pv. castaneae]|uniref:Uncharacterized protein n=1 Tax=Pseudomonas syringae pv. castaneae TaxID=264450 RepID=A0A0P9MY89_PSESX|nr:Uncharacterized protein ALO79_04722 [Pseudomonas syringae pv. castaneae]KWS87694.1 hypothetical protein AL048_12790 [Pseudomonas syringae pv. castaneae]